MDLEITEGSIREIVEYSGRARIKKFPQSATAYVKGVLVGR